jgi:hypothetical protein
VPEWTFETLAASDRRTLEEVLIGGQAPDYEQLEGYGYRGWNHERIARLTGEKFTKVFRRIDGRPFGYNLVVRQDHLGYRGVWELKLKDERPIRIGYYSVSQANGAALLNYNVDLNTGRNLPLRVIRDFVVLPNAGDHGLVLGKAYLELGLRIFYSYFVLGYREPIGR